MATTVIAAACVESKILAHSDLGPGREDLDLGHEFVTSSKALYFDTKSCAASDRACIALKKTTRRCEVHRIYRLLIMHAQDFLQADRSHVDHDRHVNRSRPSTFLTSYAIAPPA